MSGMSVFTSVFWTFDVCEDNFNPDPDLTKYLKDSCVLDFFQCFSFRYFLKIAFVR